jgi:CO/xanthine dehydrogenase Mo-binding subunit
MFVEKSGLGPSDGVKIAVDTSGAVEVITGGASIGQGFETVMAQVATEMIGVDMARVRVTHGQTDRIAFGIGAHASRATVMTAAVRSRNESRRGRLAAARDAPPRRRRSVREAAGRWLALQADQFLAADLRRPSRPRCCPAL